jgi:hypothetical protein
MKAPHGAGRNLPDGRREMDTVDPDDGDKLRRLRRLEWLSDVIEQAAREADAYRRLEYELWRHCSDEDPDAPPHRRVA